MIDKEELGTIKQWFSDYLTWMSTHRYGIKEMEAKTIMAPAGSCKPLPLPCSRTTGK